MGGKRGETGFTLLYIHWISKLKETYFSYEHSSNCSRLAGFVVHQQSKEILPLEKALAFVSLMGKIKNVGR